MSTLKWALTNSPPCSWTLAAAVTCSWTRRWTCELVQLNPCKQHCSSVAQNLSLSVCALLNELRTSLVSQVSSLHFSTDFSCSKAWPYCKCVWWHIVSKPVWDWRISELTNKYHSIVCPSSPLIQRVAIPPNINEFPYSLCIWIRNEILAAVWFGHKKPSNSTFLKPLRNTINTLFSASSSDPEGICADTIKQNKCKIRVWQYNCYV